MINYTPIKFVGIIAEDDFKRIYNLKKQTQNEICSKVQELENTTNHKNIDDMINNIIFKFEAKFEIKQNQLLQQKFEAKIKSESEQKSKIKTQLEHEVTKKYLMYFLKKVEIDSSKKIYIYLNF